MGLANIKRAVAVVVGLSVDLGGGSNLWLDTRLGGGARGEGT
jgi:hypothetical protein